MEKNFPKIICFPFLQIQFEDFADTYEFSRRGQSFAAINYSADYIRGHPVALRFRSPGERFPGLRDIRYTRLYGTMSERSFFLLTPSIHPSDQIPYVVVRLASLFFLSLSFCYASRSSSRAGPSSLVVASMPSGLLLLLLCLRVVCPSRVPGVIFIAAVREARDA